MLAQAWVRVFLLLASVLFTGKGRGYTKISVQVNTGLFDCRFNRVSAFLVLYYDFIPNVKTAPEGRSYQVSREMLFEGME